MPIKPISQLPKDNERAKQNLVNNAGVALRKAARAGSVNVIRNTPVDKGVLRSNYVANLNAPFGGTIPAYAPGRKLGLSETQNAAGAIQQNESVISQFLNVQSQDLWIVNNVDYFEKINNNGSKQSAFFFEMGGQAIETSLRASVIPLDRKLK